MFAWVMLAFMGPVSAQTFTMSNNCTKMLQQLESYNTAKMYDSVIAYYPHFGSKCTAKDAKWKGNTARAHAYNGLSQYEEALQTSNAALKANKRWIGALFERAVAYAGLGMINESKADYERIISFSNKNKDQASRSTIYSMLSDISFKQGEKDTAFALIDQAIAIDNRPEYLIQKGDFYYNDGMYDKAFEEYDKAVAAGKNDFEMFNIRASQRIKIYEKKYGTTNVNELSKKMNAEEKRLCCIAFDKLKAMGFKSLQFDLVYTFICQ